MEQVSWKDKLINHFFEPEDKVERDPNIWTLELTWWRWLLLIAVMTSVLSMTVFSYTYIYKTYRTVESICTAPIQQKSLYTAKGGMFEVSTSHGPKLVFLEPIKSDSTTHRYLKCTIPKL